jgi:hypothetical protein
MKTLWLWLKTRWIVNRIIKRNPWLLDRTHHPSVKACTPHMEKINDLNDDVVRCSVCGQGWMREPDPTSWGKFTIMQNLDGR